KTTFTSRVPSAAVTVHVTGTSDARTSVTCFPGRATRTTARERCVLAPATGGRGATQTAWVSRSSDFGSATWAGNAGAIRTAMPKTPINRRGDMDRPVVR